VTRPPRAEITEYRINRHFLAQGRNQSYDPGDGKLDRPIVLPMPTSVAAVAVGSFATNAGLEGGRKILFESAVTL
jgi:hypothetical protein